MYLTTLPIDRHALIDSVLRTSDGALVLFEGIVRNHHEGRAVESITYEAYVPMAEKEIATIVGEASRLSPETNIALQHRTGLVRVGETAILIACTHPHRAQAFESCRRVIDAIKQTVPIWKKERGPDGEEWVGWQASSQAASHFNE